MKKKPRAYRPAAPDPLEIRLAPSNFLTDLFGPLFGQSSSNDDPNARPFWEKWDDHTDPLAPDKPATKPATARRAPRASGPKARVAPLERPHLKGVAKLARTMAAGQHPAHKGR